MMIFLPDVHWCDSTPMDGLKRHGEHHEFSSKAKVKADETYLSGSSRAAIQK